MSEQEKKEGGTDVVVVEQNEGSKAFHHTHMRDSATEDTHHKSITQPIVLTTVQNITEISNATTAKTKPNQRDDTVSDVPSDSKKPKNEKSESSIENIPIDTLDMDTTKEKSLLPPTSQTSSLSTPILPTTSLTNAMEEKGENDKNIEKLETSVDEDIILEDTAAASTQKSKRSDWSPSITRKGLRSESHSSMVTRGVRKLFCCGFSYNAPSEDDISLRENHAV